VKIALVPAVVAVAIVVVAVVDSSDNQQKALQE
jgi:hypothetical protein